MDKYLCIDVGGTSIKYAMLDEALNFYQRGSVETPYEGLETYLGTLTDIYRQYQGEAKGIAISAPGFIDSENGICITGGSLSDFVEQLPLAEELEKRCGVPVTVMNDAKSAALAEVTWGALKGCQDAAVIVLGTGVGGALVKNGKVHMGKHFAAGEFSFVFLHPEMEGWESAWGARNGNKRLITMAARARGADPEEVSGFDVFAWAEEGDEKVLQALQIFAGDLAWMIMNLQVIYDPERIAIGGGISQQPLLLKLVKKQLDYRYTQLVRSTPRAEVVCCRFFNDANLIGALGYYLDKNR